MLLPIQPPARIRVIIRSHQCPIALSLVHLEEALISPTIRPVIHTEAPGLAIDPLACEFATVGPLIDSKPIDLVVHPVTLIRCTIGPFVDAVTIFLTVGVISMESLFFLQKLDSVFCSDFDALLGENFDTDSLSAILEPSAMVPHPIVKSHLADAMPHIIDPVALVCVPLHMRVLAEAVRVAQVPVALVHDPVGEAHDATAMAKAAEPLPLVRAVATLVPVALGYEQLLKFCFALVH